jgi:hypothetical protein
MCRRNALPYGIQMSSKGVPVFCELGTIKLAHQSETIAIRDYDLPKEVRPRRLAIDAQDRVYFPDFKWASGAAGSENGRSEIVGFARRRGIESVWHYNPRMGWCGTANRA